MTHLPQLTLDGCRMRQQRLREVLRELRADRAILTARENVQWLTAFRPHPLMQAAVVLDLEGDCTLIAPGKEPKYHAADHIVLFDAQWLCTLRQDQAAAIAEKVPRSQVVTALEFSSTNRHCRKSIDGAVVDVEPELLRLRRRKEADELAMLRHAIDCTDAMYVRAREILEPGINELEVFNQLQAAAVMHAGEPLTALGNDYQSNSPGGPPRNRDAESGELMILDLGPAYRGYHADNCRTFAVDRQPTDPQLEAQQAVASVLAYVRDTVQPGLKCRELFAEVKARLDDFVLGQFYHHLGHGIGLYPHEAPHLNPNWDDTFEVGDVFTAEPGLYADELRAGIRIEENYLVTADGVEQLTSTPIDL